LGSQTTDHETYSSVPSNSSPNGVAGTISFPSRLLTRYSSSPVSKCQVSDSPDIEESYYLLDGSVAALYGDYSQGTTPRAVLEIRFSLNQKSKDRSAIIFQRDYREQAPVKGNSPEQLVKGWDEVLRKILTALEEDLSKFDYKW